MHNRFARKPFMWIMVALASWGAAAVSVANDWEQLSTLLDDSTLAIAQVNLQRIDIERLEKLAGLPPAAISGSPEWQLLSLLREEGIGPIYVAVGLTELPEPGPFVYCPVPPGKSAVELLAKLQASVSVRRAMLTDLVHLHAGGLVLVNNQEQWQKMKQFVAQPRPDLEKLVLGTTPPVSVRLFVSPSADTRRVVRELTPSLPPQLGAIPAKALADGIRSLQLHVDVQDTLEFALQIQCVDAAAAVTVNEVVAKGLHALTAIDDTVPGVRDLLKGVQPVTKGEQVTIELSKSRDSSERLYRVLRTAVQHAQHRAGTMQSMNNLKAQMLAMHNYHDAHSRFPGPCSLAKDGKKLLSWRVHLLPFLDQNDLYQQFKLDEPWDSVHNQALVEKMPAVFASPLAAPQEALSGRTRYQAPGGSKTIWAVEGGARLQDITDGSSNTIALVETGSAVVWTKPDDVSVDMREPLKSLLGDESGTVHAILVAFCDGSAHAFPTTIDAETMRRLLQMNDGEVVQIP